MWLLALVFALQAVAAGWLATLGPVHVHVGGAEAPALIDWRRAPTRPPADARVPARATPAHAAPAGVRHHHPAAEAGVVRIADDDGVAALDIGESVSFTSIPALLPFVDSWQAPDRADERAWRPSWALLTGFVQPLERPPKTA